MTATDSTLRTYPVGGQLDPAWLASAIPWTHVRATAVLSRPDDGAPVVDPTNGAHEHPLTVVNTLTAAAADGQWATAPLKPTVSDGADLSLVPSGLTWQITLEIKRGATWHEVIGYTVAPSGDQDYDGDGDLITVDGDDCIDVNALIPPPASIPANTIFEDAVLDVLADHPEYGAADMSVSRTSTTVTVVSATGTDATLPAATTSLAGQLTATDKTKLDGIEAGATADQTAAEVPVTPTGNLAATNTQAALAEHQGDIDGLTSKTAGVASGASTHMTAQTGAELRGWGYTKVATTASLPGTGSAGEIYDVGGALHYWDSAAAAWQPINAGRIYPYLKNYTTNAIHPAILRDLARGALKVGDIIQTTAYYDPTPPARDLGGACYRVVAAATGTDDGGSYINAGSYQLKGIFGPEIRVSQFGVKPQGFPSIDYATAIQNAVNAAAFTASSGLVMGGGRVVIDLWVQINSTILVDNAATKIVGITGHSFYTDTYGSGLIWGGAADTPMIEFRDSNGGGVERLSLIGNNTNPPIGIRHSYGNNAPGQGQNITHDQVRIGWHPAYSGGSGKVAKGIEITGEVDLDRFFIRDTEIHGVVDAGIDIINTQGTWNQIQNVLVNNAVTGMAGTGTAVRTRSDCSLLNFNANGMALVFDIGPNNLWCGFIGAENCTKLVDGDANLNVWVSGGYCDVNSATTNAAFVDVAGTGATGRVTFANVDFRSVGNVWPTGVTFKVGSNSSADYGALRLLDCRNVPLSAIDVSGVTSTGRLLVEFDGSNAGSRLLQVVRSGDSLEVGRFDPGTIVAITGATGSIYKLAVDSSGRLTINGTVVGTQS